MSGGNLSTWSIHNPVATTLLFALLTLAGAAGFMAMKVQDFPDIEFPEVSVDMALPGASPAQLENDVARKVEDALANLQGIDHITSTLSDGQARVTAEFVVGKPVREAMDEVRDAVAAIRAQLPAALEDPVITRKELADTPVLTYAVSSSSLDAGALSWLVDGQVSRRLRGVPGVGRVSRVGGVDREVRVALDPAALHALQTTAGDISRQLARSQQEASGGRVELGGSEHAVRALGRVTTADDVAALDIQLADGRRVRLNEIADVRDTAAEPRTMALLDGEDVVAFEVLRARGAGELEVAAGVRAAIDALRAGHPDVRFHEAVNAVDPIADNYAGSMLLLYEGAALAVLVVFFFLRDWRATLIAAVALPLSAIPTFAVMHVLGFSLNTVSLLSLSLVVGVLVDDAIVEIENIERHLLDGKPPLQAASDAASEIGLAVVATTFTLVAVFVPTSLMGGVVGRYFVQFGWTAAIAVLFSLLVARMLTPMMAAWLLKAPTRPHATPAWVERYLRWVRACLRHRMLTLGGAVGLVVLGLVAASQLPGEFMPPDDSDRIQVQLTLPPGSTLEQTRALAEQARGLVRGHAQVASVFAALGTGGGGDDDDAAATSGISLATLTVTLHPRAMRDGVRRQTVENELRIALQALPGARVAVGGGGSEGYALVLAAEDGDLLERTARSIERALRGLQGVGAVTSSASLVRPELVVRPDPVRAAELGVDAEAIAQALRVATVGDYRQDLAKLNMSERQIPVVVRLSDAGRDDLDTLRRLTVAGTHGPVALEDVATLEMVTGPAELTRRDRLRNTTLQVELNGRPLGDVEAEADALPVLLTLPNGVVRAAAGDAEIMGELVQGFLLAMGAGVLCVYMVLVLLLKDFVQPLTVLVALVLSIPGAFLALLLTGGTLSMPSMIGLIMLMGITTKNSILLVDYIVIARKVHGLRRQRAIIDACRKRVRPIVMTTIAMTAGMVPIALGIGADPSFRMPMAIVVIGGLLTSTVLCLLVIPVVYSLVDDALRLVHARLRGGMGRQSATSAEQPAC